MPKEQSFGVIAIHIDTEGIKRFLIVKQINGKWGFPKGRAEMGESAREAALREFQEETGITSCTLLTGGPFREHYIKGIEEADKRDKSVTYFFGITDSTAVSVQESEISDYRFATAEEALELLTYDVSKNTFREALKALPVSLATKEGLLPGNLSLPLK